MSREETQTAAAAVPGEQIPPTTPQTQAKIDSFLVRAYPGAYPEKEAAVKATIAVERLEAASNQQQAAHHATSPKHETMAETVSGCLFTFFGGTPIYGMRLGAHPEAPSKAATLKK